MIIRTYVENVMTFVVPFRTYSPLCLLTVLKGPVKTRSCQYLIKQPQNDLTSNKYNYTVYVNYKTQYGFQF